MVEDHRARYQWAAGFVRQRRPPGRRVTVLDLAAGTGYGSEMMAAAVDRIIGIDLSESAIRECRRRFDDRLIFVQADAVRLPLGEGSCDFVVSFETVEHIPLASLPRYYGEVHRVLRPGGWLLISTPNRKLTSPFQGRDNPDNPHHCFEWTKSEFIAGVGKHYQVESIWGQRFLPRPLAWLPARRFLSRLRHPSVPFSKKWSSWHKVLYSPERGGPQVGKTNFWREPRYTILAARRT